MIKRNGNAIRMRKEGAETNPYVGKGDFLWGQEKGRGNLFYRRPEQRTGISACRTGKKSFHKIRGKKMAAF